MTRRDPLIDAIRAAGEVPPPPDRDAAFARAMQPVLMPSRRRLNRGFIALFAAALLAVPAAVFAAHETRTDAAAVTPIVSERADPGASIHAEADDATLTHRISHQTESEHRTQTPTSSGEHTTATSGGSDDHSGPGPSPSPAESSGNSGPGGGDAHPSVSPTPTESSGSSSSGSEGGSSTSGATIDGSTSGGTTGSH